MKQQLNIDELAYQAQQVYNSDASLDNDYEWDFSEDDLDNPLFESHSNQDLLKSNKSSYKAGTKDGMKVGAIGGAVAGAAVVGAGIAAYHGGKKIVNKVKETFSSKKKPEPKKMNQQLDLDQLSNNAQQNYKKLDLDQLVNQAKQNHQQSYK